MIRGYVHSVSMPRRDIRAKEATVANESSRTTSRVGAANLFPGAESPDPYRRRDYHEHGAYDHRVLVLRHFPARAAASLHRTAGFSDPPRHLRTGPAADSTWHLAQATKSTRERD